MRSRLFLQVFSLEARKWMSYRADFWLNTVAGFSLQLTVYWFLWSAMFSGTEGGRIGGYTLGGMMLYYVLVILQGRIVRGVEMGGALAQEIYQGTYSRYVLYPVDFFAFKYAQHLGALFPAFVQLLLFAAAAPFLFDLPAGVSITPGSVAMAAVALLVGNVLNFLLLYPVEGVAFWADNVWSLMVMMRFVSNLLGGQLLPLDLFPGWAQGALEALPFAYLFYFPAKTLLGQVDPAAWLQGMAMMFAWCALLAVAGRTVWRRGDLQYTGVGI